LEALGEELDRPESHPGPVTLAEARTAYLGTTLRQAADGAGPGRVKGIRASTRHKNPRVRAAAFHLWLGVAYDKGAGVDRNEYQAAVRHGLKDDSPLLRGQAAVALHAFRDWPPDLLTTGRAYVNQRL
jgi:hypothetical protein